MDGLSSTQRRVLLYAAIAALVAMLLYGPTLRLPLIYDTLLHIRITKELDWLSVWLPTGSFGFYRPLTFVPLLLVKGIWGDYPAPLLHLSNILQHGANAALLVLLVWRLYRRPLFALASGLIFAAYPFSYQAVAVYGHNVHPALVNLFLLGLHTYLSGLRRKQRRYWWLTGIILLLALLTHESAVLFGPFAALVDWQARGKQNLWRDLRGQLASLRQLPLPFLRASGPWLGLTAAGVLYVLVYQLLPITRAPQASTLSGGALNFKLLYAFQAIAYPLVWVQQKVLFTFFWLLFWGCLLLFIGLVIWGMRRSRNQWPIFFGLCWWGLASLLIIIPLPTGYLLNGPRLLYLSSVGVAIVWPHLFDFMVGFDRQPTGPPNNRPANSWRQFLWAALLTALLISNSRFVVDRLHAYENLTSPVALVDEVMSQRPTDEGALLINLPQWLGPMQKIYPFGAEFVVMMGDYLFVEELVEENVTGDAYQLGRSVQAVAVRDLQRDPDYGYTVHSQHTLDGVGMDWEPAGSHLFLTYYWEDGIETRYTGQLTDEAMGPAIAEIGPYTFHGGQAVWCAGRLDISTIWRLADATGELIPSTSLFVQLIDASGQLVAQADGPPLGLRIDLIEPVVGWKMIDERSMMVAQAATEGQLLIGVYDFVTNERYPVAGSANDALVVDMVSCST